MEDCIDCWDYMVDNHVFLLRRVRAEQDNKEGYNNFGNREMEQADTAISCTSTNISISISNSHNVFIGSLENCIIQMKCQGTSSIHINSECLSSQE